MIQHLKPLLLFALLTLFVFPVHSFSSFKEGDTLSFWSVSYIDWVKGTLPQQYKITAVCKKVGVYCYFFQDIASSNIPSAQIVDSWVAKFDTSYMKLTDLYGPVPDALDNDPRVFLLSIKPDWWGGYFDPTHQMSDTMVNRLWGIHSTEREIIYLNSKMVVPGNEFMMVHELGHMIHWGQDHSPEPPENPTYYWEDTWIDEGFSTFADVYMNQDINQSGVLDNRPFINEPNAISLINFSNYDCSKLWMVYLYENFGGKKLIKALLKNQLNGIAGVDSTLKQLGYKTTFNSVFESWALANYLDDDESNFLLNYKHFNFPPRKHRFEKKYEWKSAEVLLDSGSLPAYATDYLKYDAGMLPYGPTRVSISGDKGSKFAAYIIKFDSSGKNQELFTINFTDSSNGSIIIPYPKMTSGYFVVAVMNENSNLAAGDTMRYRITFETNTTSVSEFADENCISVYFDKNNELIVTNVNDILAKITDYILVDILGNPVSAGSFSDDEIRIGTSGLARGKYFLVLPQKGQKIVKGVLVY